MNETKLNILLYDVALDFVSEILILILFFVGLDAGNYVHCEGSGSCNPPWH